VVGRSAPYDVSTVLRRCDVLFVVPPFAWLDRPALGVHLLQAHVRAAGLEAQVLYANALFAAWFGERTATTLSNLQFGWFLGERLFARTAFGVRALGHDGGEALVAEIEKLAAKYRERSVPFQFGLENLRAIEEQVPAWLDSFVPQLAAVGHRVVGATSSFEQTSSSIAILRELKARTGATTLLGGANCEGPMADGLAALGVGIDHIFSGESDAAFPAWLAAFRRGEQQPRIVHGAPCQDLDALPVPDFSDYRAQLRAFLPRSTILAESQISFETSRGCWWGAKSHCTFCGLNGRGMASRTKSPDRAMSELRTLLVNHPTQRVAVTDNIMPHEYWKTFVPRLGRELPGVRMMYEQKANLTLRQVMDLVAAGIDEIQPGIEALSTGLLALMAKGTTSAQNLALLRYARATGMRLQWNLLFGFPGDSLAFYEETRELLPLLHHLPPPRGPIPVVIDRFSPYHDHPDRYGITGLRPVDGYRAWLPPGAEIDKIAYHFEGTFASESRERLDVMAELSAEITRWRDAYYGQERPELRVERSGDGYLLVDTRAISELAGERDRARPIDARHAAAVLVRRSLRAHDDASRWAIAQCAAVERDGKIVPLATAAPELLLEIESSTPIKGELTLAS